MRLSRYFLPILRETPKEAEIVSHRLMLRAGMIRQQSAGIYSWLPLGKRVLDKVNRIIRQEQDRSGAIELLMPTLQTAEASGTAPTLTLNEMLEAVEKDALQDALKSARGNRAKAARLLGATERVFNYRVRRYRIDWKRFRA